VRHGCVATIGVETRLSPGGGSQPPGARGCGVTDRLRPVTTSDCCGRGYPDRMWSSLYQTELPAARGVRAGFEPATYGIREPAGPARSRWSVAVVGWGRMRGVEPHSLTAVRAER
jgi:hypothetical protein